MTKRRIMQELEIFEISAVDIPAQEGAKALVMKSPTPRIDALRKAHAETYGPPRSQFQQIAASIRHDTGCSRTEALQKAARAHPDALDAFRKGDGRAASGGGGSREAARQKFNLIVEGIRHRKGKTRTAAMSIARREHPTEFEAAYGS